MRFMLCARDRSSGAMSLLSADSYPTRREAVEAISGVRDLSWLSGADVFLVDLETATPVAIVPWRAEEGAAKAAAPDTAPVDRAAVEAAPPSESAVPPAPEGSESEGADDDESQEELPYFDAVSLGTLEIDLDAWTCEDCIYISTCAKSGTLRPAECGAFQWRA